MLVHEDERNAALQKAEELKEVWGKAKERWDRGKAEAARCGAESASAEAEMHLRFLLPAGFKS